MRGIYKPTGRAGEYGEYAINIYTGCPHGCTYCYAALNAKRWSRPFGEAGRRPGLVEQVERDLVKMKGQGKVIHLCFTCDPYPRGADTSDTRAVIQAIKASGNHVQILTKGGIAATHDFDLLDQNDWFGITLTGNDDLEPNAAPGSERHASLKEAYVCGIKTWVSFEPVYTPTLVYDYIEHSTAINLYKIGKLNHYASTLDWAAFGRRCVELCEANGRAFQLKADLLQAMEGGGHG